jgi:hypothetical protein
MLGLHLDRHPNYILAAFMDPEPDRADRVLPAHRRADERT